MSKALGAAFGSAVCMSLGVSLYMGTFPLFLKPVSEEFGWGAEVYPQAALVIATVMALAGPLAGKLIDRLGVRPVLFVSLVGWAVCLAGLSWLSGSRIQLLSLAALMGIFAAASGPIAYAKVVAGWFDRHRGLALGIVLNGAPALATAILIGVTSTLLAEQGWRDSYRILGAAAVCLTMPLAFVFIREAQSHDGSGERQAENLGGSTLSQALRSREFWKVILLTGLVCGVTQSLVAHFMAFSAQYGVSSPAAAIALSAYSLAGPVGSLAAGTVADRVSSPKALAIFYSLPLFGFSSLVLLGAAAAIPAMILMGAGFQAAAGMQPYLLTRYFGVRDASQLFGIGLGIMTLSLGGGPVILGFVRDRLQSFTPATPALLVLLVAAFASSVTLRKYAAVRGAGPDRMEGKQPRNQ
jgi:MFS family permease